MTPAPSRRLAVLAVLAALLAGVAVVDRTRDDETPVAAVGPEGANPDALTTSWYCHGGPGTGPLQPAVVVMNPGDTRAKGTITVYPAGGKPVSKPLDVPPAASRNIPIATFAAGPWVSALVDFDGGGVVVEQQVTGAAGADTSACSPTASTRWYFATGSTAKDAVLSLALFNPFPDDAILDLSFATGEGRREPGDFQGLVVPAESVRLVDVGAHVRRQEVVSTEVKVRIGRVVAGQQLVRTAPGVAGVSTYLGSPTLGEQWFFPDGLVSPGVVEKYEILNPNDEEARVDILLALEKDDVEPFELTIPAQGRFTLDVGAEGRVPNGVAHAAVAESINGVPVVVQRVIQSQPPRAGRADTLGARRPARSWGFSIGSTSATRDQWIVVQNMGERPATVSVTAMADGRRVPVEGLQGVVVEAGRRAAFRLSDHIKRDNLPLVVTSTVPVVVERSLYAVGSPGVSMSLGIALD